MSEADDDRLYLWYEEKHYRWEWEMTPLPLIVNHYATVELSASYYLPIHASRLYTQQTGRGCAVPVTELYIRFGAGRIVC